MKKSREFKIDTEYICFVDAMNENEWNSLISKFKDATINQSWAWASTMSSRTSNLVIKKNGVIVGAAILRLVTIPILNAGLAYKNGIC